MKEAANSNASIERIRTVKRNYETKLLGMANVVGVGIGYRNRAGIRTKDPAIVVMVKKKLPLQLLSPTDIIPAEIEGIPVDVQEVGQITAY